jgi:hypothetical protein
MDGDATCAEAARLLAVGSERGQGRRLVLSMGAALLLALSAVTIAAMSMKPAQADPGSSTIQPNATVGGITVAWGENASGQLGDGTNSDSNDPVRVRNLKGVTGVDGGVLHSLAT